MSEYKPYLGQNNSGKVYDPKVTKPLRKSAAKPLRLSLKASPDGAMIIAYTYAK